MKSKYVTFEDLVRFHREVIAPDLDARLTPLLREVFSIQDKVTSIDEKVDDHHREVLDRFDHVYSRLDAISVEYTALKGGLKRVEKRLSKLDGSTN
jgi:hypothetical protein